MSKIFCVGLSRTGTTSFHHQMLEWGYDSIHYPNQMQLISGNYDTISDIPVAHMYKTLDKMYPNSKFVYTWRENWIDNVEEYFLRKSNRPNQSRSQVMLRSEVYGSPFWDKETYLKAYENHENDVFEYFFDRPDDLLVLNITSGESPQKLADFIRYRGLVKDKFPHANRLNK